MNTDFRRRLPQALMKNTRSRRTLQIKLSEHWTGRVFASQIGCVSCCSIFYTEMGFCQLMSTSFWRMLNYLQKTAKSFATLVCSVPE